MNNKVQLTKKSLFKKSVEEKIANSSTLPVMNFAQAKEYMFALKSSLVETTDDELKAQFFELCSYFNINAAFEYFKIQQKRIQNSSYAEMNLGVNEMHDIDELRCGINSYLALIEDQLEDAGTSKECASFIKQQKKEAAFILS